MNPGVLAGLLTLAPAGADVFTGAANGPLGKRAYGGLPDGGHRSRTDRTARAVPAGR